MTDTDHLFPVRVQRTVDGAARVYTRGQAFDVDSQASLRESDPHPSAVEYLLGALGGDLLCGLQREANARCLKIHDIEVSLTGRLDNLLVQLGVIGEDGHPGFAAIHGTAYVATDSQPDLVDAAWRVTLARSPLFNTLSRCASIDITVRIVA